MTLWQRFKAACRDQRGQFDFGGGFDNFGIPDISQGGGIPGSMETSVGPAISFGPVGQGGSDFGSILSGFGDFARTLLPYLSLGTQGLGLGTGIMGALHGGQQAKLAEKAAIQQKKLASEAETAAAPLAGFSGQQLQLAQQGQIPAAQQAQIDQWRQAARQQAMNYAAQSGQGDSQTLQSWLAWIDQQAQAMKTQALLGEQQMGIQAGGTAGGILGQAMQGTASQANIANQNAGGIDALIAAANQVLARLNASAV